MEDIAKLITNYGITTIISGVVIYFGLKLGNYYFKKMTDQVNQPGEHMFFTNINKNIEFKLPTVRLTYHGEFAKGRTKIFQDMLIIKLKIWTEKLREATNKKGNLNTIYQNTLIDIYHGYINERKEREIPFIVVDKFNEWHQPLIEMYQRSIENICNSKGYSSRVEKQNAILEISSAMVVFTILDGEKTLGSLNGELTGLKYKGILIL